MALYCSISVYESNGSSKVWEIKNTKVSIAIIKLLAFIDFKNTKGFKIELEKEKKSIINCQS